ncbi:hypothetical protein OAU93_01695 [bacterium]|nr:hypothetical protein [bacterium]
MRGHLKIKIICDEHGEFSQKPSAHLQGRGCAKCGKLFAKDFQSQRAISTKEFISKAREVHGDNYDYSKVEYVNSQTKVVILCPKHGLFEQKAGIHLRGSGCSRCSWNAKRSTSEFIAEARAVHGETYDYSLTNYQMRRAKIKITCKKHGVFEQMPYQHLKGQGCRQCDIDSRTFSTTEFITRSKILHGDRYDYSKAIYKNSISKTTITCREHGDFEQTPNSHWKGAGCPVCYTTGNSTTTLYLVSGKVNSEAFLKIGITRFSLRRRFSFMRYDYPNFKFCKIDTMVFDHPNIAQEVEQNLHEALRRYKFIPSTKFGGYTECFLLDHRKHILTAFRAAKQKYEG